MACRVLIVEDEEPLRSLLPEAVARPSLEVMVAENASRALAIAAQFAPLHLVITDIVMPGMDGIELALRFLENGYADRFLFISGDVTCGDRMMQVLTSLRGFAFLGKPFSIPVLRKTVDRLLATQGF